MSASLTQSRGFYFDVESSYEAMSRRACDLITDQLRRKPDLLLCAATGGSPTRTYGLLAEKRKNEPELFSHLRVLKLDDWGGLAMDDPGTSETYLQSHLLHPLGISSDRYTAFISDTSDPEAECARIEALLEHQGPIDVCVLGLGLNGHLAFNEPAESLQPRVHVAKLSAQTLLHPMVQKARGNVEYGLTLGMANLLASTMILLLANGSHKREPLARLREPNISTHFPASFLWLHGNALCLCDEEAAR